MDSEYGRHYRALFEQHWWWRAREEMILKVLRRYRPATGWTRILDVGCGDGLFFGRLAAFSPVVEGVEPASELVTDTGRAIGTIHEVPFDRRFAPKERFGLIVMLDVLEHLDQPESALAHAVELLQPGGMIVITVPAFRALWTRHDDINHHRTRYNRSTFAEVAREAAFEIDWTEYSFHWTVPAKLMQRAVEACVPGEPRPASIPAPPINRFLYLATRLEQTVLAPLRLPFGSSLLVVGGRPGERNRRLQSRNGAEGQAVQQSTAVASRAGS